MTKRTICLKCKQDSMFTTEYICNSCGATFTQGGELSSITGGRAPYHFCYKCYQRIVDREVYKLKKK